MNLDVVVVTYNSADQLPHALSGLPSGVRTIVVDNASDDASIDVARRLGVEVVANPVNAGFGVGANLGVGLGSADLVLLLNPDARVTPELVHAMCQRMVDDPQLGVVSPRLIRPDGVEQRVWWPLPSAGGAWREALGLHRLRKPRTNEGFVIGACFLVRRTAFEALGGFDERFWLYSEESDFCRRAQRAGWKVELDEDLVAEQVGGASGKGMGRLVFEHFERGGEHIVAKHDGARALVSYRLANLGGAALRSVLPGPERRRTLQRARVHRLLGTLGNHPKTVRFDSPATQAPSEGLVVCSLEPWDDVWRRNQFLVRELLKRDPNRRVLFVEPPFDWVHELRHSRGRRRLRGLRPLDGDGRIVRVEPGKVWPRVLGSRADRSLRFQVRKASAELGLASPALWVNDPHYAGLATETSWPSVYDVTDDWTLSGDGDRATTRVSGYEARLFAEVGAVVVCSDVLADARRGHRPDLVVIPNAVDGGHLTRPRRRPDDLPSGRCAVYVGTLHEDRLDVDLVLELARSLPELTVVLVGPNSLSEASVAALASMGNVRLLGARSYDDVPGYLQHADVVIVPHVVTPFTESLDPIKAYECVVVGRPTVATPVAGFRNLGAPIVCADRDAYVAAVTEALDRPTGGVRSADVPSWADRAEAFEQALVAAQPGSLTRKVVFVDHCAKLSGGELALVRLLPALIDLGIDAHVILGESGPLEAKLAATGATVEVLALDERVGQTHRDEVRVSALGLSRAIAAGRDTFALARRLRELEPDLVHTNSLKSAIYGGVAGRLARVPVVWHVRDRIADDYLPPTTAKVIRALSLVLPDAVIANSQATRATLGVLQASVVVPSPVVYDPLPPTHRPAVVPSGLDLRVAMVGRLAHWKGQHVFLEAFAEAFAGGAQQAIIVGEAMFGEDDYAAEIEELATRLGIRDQVVFTGFIEDVSRILTRVDCLVHASVIAEPFGQVVIEGMVAGLPVVASAEGGPLEVITDGVDGLLFPPGDTQALATILKRLAHDPQLRVALGKAARVRAKDFAPEVVAAEVLEAYQWLFRSRDLSPRERRTIMDRRP